MAAGSAAIGIDDPPGLSGDASVRPPLKWAGGKRRLVPRLRPLWEPERHRRLVEPFAGGLAVTLALRPHRAILNDINPHLVNFYRWLQRGLRIPGPFGLTAEEFYRSRDRFNALLASGQGFSAEAAGLFYYLNRTGYNGLCRFNRRGEFNVPFGQHVSVRYQYDFSEYQSVLRPWTFTSAHFLDVPLKSNDFVYADPPYDVPFTQYSKERFGWEDQVATSHWLARHQGPVVLSNQATPRILELYRDDGYDLITFHAPRRISCTGDRSPALEVLATRNLPMGHRGTSGRLRSIQVRRRA